MPIPLWLLIVIVGWACLLIGFLIGLAWNNPKRWRVEVREKEEVILELCGKLEEYRERIRKIKEELEGGD